MAFGGAAGGSQDRQISGALKSPSGEHGSFGFGESIVRPGPTLGLSREKIVNLPDLADTGTQSKMSTTVKNSKMAREPATIELLKPLATTGEVIPVVDSSFYRMRQNLCKEMRVRWPENCLRNSYATYAQTFRSSGDAMLDLCRDALYFPYRTINILFFSFSSQLVIAVAT